MARPSRDRLNELAREIVRAVSRSRAVILLKDAETIRQAVALALADELTRQEAREETARTRIAAIKNGPKAHTPEWEVLFRRFVDEEYLREGLDS
jgi:hypothetical protein